MKLNISNLLFVLLSVNGAHNLFGSSVPGSPTQAVNAWLEAVREEYDSDTPQKDVDAKLDTYFKEIDNVDVRDALNRTALIIAAGTRMIDNYKVVDYLLRKKADVNAKDNAGNTALMEAAKGGNPKVVALLLEKGADPKAENMYSNTALSMAREIFNWNKSRTRYEIPEFKTIITLLEKQLEKAKESGA